MSQPDLPGRRLERLVAIHPVPEYQDDQALGARYEEMKLAFDVPWMGVVAMVHAYHCSFCDCLWDGLREIELSSLFEAHCRELRRETETALARLPQGAAREPVANQLRAMGYDARELGEIRQTLEIFSAGNYPYLLLASVRRLLLAGDNLAGSAAPYPAERSRATEPNRLVLMEAHHATQDPIGLALREHRLPRLGALAALPCRRLGSPGSAAERPEGSGNLRRLALPRNGYRQRIPQSPGARWRAPPGGRPCRWRSLRDRGHGCAFSMAAARTLRQHCNFETPTHIVERASDFPVHPFIYCLNL